MSLLLLDTNIISKLARNKLNPFITATCIVHKRILVLRNVKDFQFTSVQLLNPFD